MAYFWCFCKIVQCITPALFMFIKYYDILSTSDNHFWRKVVVLTHFLWFWKRMLFWGLTKTKVCKMRFFALVYVIPNYAKNIPKKRLKIKSGTRWPWRYFSLKKWLKNGLFCTFFIFSSVYHTGIFCVFEGSWKWLTLCQSFFCKNIRFFIILRFF